MNINQLTDVVQLKILRTSRR